MQFPKPKYIICVALFKTAHGLWKPFLDITPQDIQDSLQVNITAAFSSARNTILEFKDNDIEQPNGKRGTSSLIFTGGQSSFQGTVTTSAFSAGSLALEFCHRAWQIIFMFPMCVVKINFLFIVTMSHTNSLSIIFCD
jgi:hypothetical protein